MCVCREITCHNHRRHTKIIISLRIVCLCLETVMMKVIYGGSQSACRDCHVWRCVVAAEEPHLAWMRDTENVKLQPSQAEKRHSNVGKVLTATTTTSLTFEVGTCSSTVMTTTSSFTRAEPESLGWIPHLNQSLTYHLLKGSVSSSTFWTVAQSVTPTSVTPTCPPLACYA